MAGHQADAPSFGRLRTLSAGPAVGIVTS
jgi:hypothetical protein